MRVPVQCQLGAPAHVSTHVLGLNTGKGAGALLQHRLRLICWLLPRSPDFFTQRNSSVCTAVMQCSVSNCLRQHGSCPAAHSMPYQISAGSSQLFEIWLVAAGVMLQDWAPPGAWYDKYVNLVKQGHLRMASLESQARRCGCLLHRRHTGTAAVRTAVRQFPGVASSPWPALHCRLEWDEPCAFGAHRLGDSCCNRPASRTMHTQVLVFM